MDAEIFGRESDLRLLIIDNRTCLREAMESSLKALDVFAVEQAESIASLQNNGEFLRNLRTIDHLVVLYCCGTRSLTETSEDLGVLKQTFPSKHVVLLADEISIDHIKLFDQHQLDGLAYASLTTTQLKYCMLLIHAGVPFLPIQVREKGRAAVADVAGINFDELEVELTPRQKEVLKYVALGKSNKYIAAELSVCESTIKVHVHDLMKRLGATSRTHASYLVSRMATPESKAIKVLT